MTVFKNTQLCYVTYIPTLSFSETPGPVAVPVAMETRRILDEVHSPEPGEARRQQLQEAEACRHMGSAAARPSSERSHKEGRQSGKRTLCFLLKIG